MEDGKRPTVGNFGRYRFFDLEILFYPAVRFFGEPFFLADFECCLAVIFFFFLQTTGEDPGEMSSSIAPKAHFQSGTVRT